MPAEIFSFLPFDTVGSVSTQPCIESSSSLYGGKNKENMTEPKMWKVFLSRSILPVAHWDEKELHFPAKEKGGRYVIKWRFLAVNSELSESAIVQKSSRGSSTHISTLKSIVGFAA